VSRRLNDVSIRRLLGATSGHIAQQLLVESAILGLAGGATGWAFAWTLLRLLVLLPGGLPRGDVIRLDGTPLLGVVAVTIVAVVLVTVLPITTIGRRNTASSLRIDTRSGTETHARQRVRQWLVGSQIALALVMLASAGLLVHSLEKLQSINLGYRSSQVFLISPVLPITEQNAEAKSMAFLEEAAPRLRAVPGVIAITPILIAPFFGPQVWAAAWETESRTDPEQWPRIGIEIGGSEYFRTFDIPIFRGRGFLDADRENAARVAVVSEGAARLLWPGEDPIGKRLRISGDTARQSWRTVVGVAGDIRYRNLREATPSVYLPWRQYTWNLLAIRTQGELNALLPTLRRMVEEVDPEASIGRIQSLDDLLDQQFSLPRFSALLLSGFGLVALLLAAIGLYGVMASAVDGRTHELGVRLALGATPQQLLGAVLREAILLTGTGALVGLAGALAATRVLSSLLYDVSPTDPTTLIGVAALLLIVAIMAAYLPARRATRIDPSRALRSE
jgi:putative ABC transport system permease protein